MVDVSTLNKDDLAEYAKTTHNVDLDKTQPWAKLQAQVKKLETGGVKPEAKVEKAVEKPQATHILNRDTNLVFPYTEALRKHLTNAIPCDENGNPV
jgi:RecB family exonuclease